MNNWKTFAVCLVIYLLVRTCGGCNGCSSGGSIPKPRMEKLLERLSDESGFAKHELLISDVNLIIDNPPTYEFKARGPYGTKLTGRCTVHNSGTIDGFSVSME